MCLWLEGADCVVGFLCLALAEAQQIPVDGTPATEFKEREAIPNVEGAGESRLLGSAVQQRLDLTVGQFARLE